LESAQKIRRKISALLWVGLADSNRQDLEGAERMRRAQ